MNELTLKTDERTKSLNRLSGSSESVRIRESKRVIDKSAEDIMNFVSRTRLEIAIYKDLFESGFNALVNAYSIWKAYFKDSEELSKAKESVLQLKGITLNTIHLVVIYRGILVSFPNMTTSFSKAKKQALNVLDDLIRKFEFIVQLVDEFEKGDNN